MVVRVDGIAFVQQILVALHQRIHILGGLHLHADIVNPLLQIKKILAQVVEDRDRLISFPEGKLAHIADAACAVPCQSAIEEEALRFPDQVHQGGFSGSVAANQRAVTVLIQLERNVLKQIAAAESKGKFFGFDHKNPSIKLCCSRLS